MPRTSSFSVRDILDLPQMKSSAEGSVTNGAVDSDAISHATDLYAAASAQRLQGIFIHDDNYIFRKFISDLKITDLDQRKKN